MVYNKWAAKILSKKILITHEVCGVEASLHELARSAGLLQNHAVTEMTESKKQLHCS